jgi:hypothetical protein
VHDEDGIPVVVATWKYMPRTRSCFLVYLEVFSENGSPVEGWGFLQVYDEDGVLL